jgi:protein-tyrosine phosphatase
VNVHPPQQSEEKTPMRFWPSKAVPPELQVLMVCTGNICRSPTAEAVLRHLLVQARLDGRVAVDSAGTQAMVGWASDPRSAAAAQRRGYELGRRKARALRDEDFDRFELIVAMDESHLDALAQRCPAGARERLSLLMEHGGASLGRREVPDPYYGNPEGFELVLDLIEVGCRGLLATVRQRLAQRAPPG